MTDWSEFTECSAQCGTGDQKRSRAVILESRNGGSTCPMLEESRKCNTTPCPEPKDCEVGPWTDFTECSKQCGGGEQQRTRETLAEPQNGGAACPELKQERPCNAQPCIPSQDCQVSAWSLFSDCSKQCGSGMKSRSRTMVLASANNGAACPKLTQQAACNTSPCRQDCVMSQWGVFGACSVECGGGIYTRSRSVTGEPTGGGAQCGVTEEEGKCNTHPCGGEQCELEEWAAWSTCSQPCGSGSASRTRNVISKPSEDAQCGDLMESRVCNTQTCVQECTVSRYLVCDASSLTRLWSTGE